MAIGLAEAGTSHFFAILGRTDLRIGVSEAKFDVEVDFDVKKSKKPPKSAENHEKTKKIAKKNSEKNFRRRKIESCKSSETRFPEVSRRSEPSSRGERRKKFAWSRVFTPKQNRNVYMLASKIIKIEILPRGCLGCVA